MTLTLTPVWTNREVAGLLPMMLSNIDDRDAVTQLDANYQHGGGWRDFEGFELRGIGAPPVPDEYPWNAVYEIVHSGDPAMRELSRCHLHSDDEDPQDTECVVLFEGSWVAVIQEDGTYRISRMD